MSIAIREAARKLYRPPFRYECGYIFDADHHMVADQTAHSLRVRGWGRISYMKDPREIQDAVGVLIAEALTAAWAATEPTP
jgi:hypothetical protein